MATGSTSEHQGILAELITQLIDAKSSGHSLLFDPTLASSIQAEEPFGTV